MSYTNHILFSSLDEARRHQRGEEVGRPARDEKPGKTRPTTYKPREGSKPHVSVETKREIASLDLPVAELAEMYSVSGQSVLNYRKQYGDGREYSSAHPSKPKLDKRSQAERLEMALQTGSLEEVAAIYSVYPYTIKKARSEFREERRQHLATLDLPSSCGAKWLTDAQKQEIITSQESAAALADKFRVSRQTIYVLRRKPQTS